MRQKGEDKREKGQGKGERGFESASILRPLLTLPTTGLKREVDCLLIWQVNGGWVGFWQVGDKHIFVM